tara:strand:+ start:2245 stop:2580 length:336 start_codon:yes stop_codon:yes gene_type:complete
MTKKNTASSEPIVKKTRKKRGPYKKKSKVVAISAKKPSKKIIVGDVIVTNLTNHFANIIDGAIAEKRRLVKSKEYKNKKGKKNKYVINPDGSIKSGKKSNSGKNIINVHYN